MTLGESRSILIELHRQKATQALATMRQTFAAGDLSAALNRAYYACFYSASALFLQRGQTFVKHKGLKAAIHRDLVAGGLLPVRLGAAFDRIMEGRQEADYNVEADVSSDEVARIMEDAEAFVRTMHGLIPPSVS